MTKEERREYNRLRYPKIRAAFIESKGGVCAKCGSKDKLEVDHINPAGKSFNSSKWLTVSNAVRDAEFAKCQVLCKVCHNIKSVTERGQTLTKGQNIHGTLTAILYCGPPTCAECRRVKNDYTREYRRKYGR